MKGLKLEDISILKFGDTFKYYSDDYESSVYFCHSVTKDSVTMENLDDADTIIVYADNLNGWYHWNG